MKPSPKATLVVCTLCGLPWERHEAVAKAKALKAGPTAETCVELLKADLAKRPLYQYGQLSGTTGINPLVVRGIGPNVGNYSA